MASGAISIRLALGPGVPHLLPLPLQTIRRHAPRTLGGGALVGLIGLSLYLVFWQLRGDRHWRAAQEALANNDLAAARTQLLEFVQEHPSNPDGHFLLARTDRRLGQFQEAVEHLHQYERLGGILEALELEQLLMAAQRAELTSGEDKLRAYVARGHPDTVLILEALVPYYLQAMRVGEALVYLEEWLKREPERGHAWFWRGRAFEIQKNYGEALASYRRAVELAPAFQPARLRLAQQLLRASDAGAARVHFQQLAEVAPDNREVLSGLARAQFALGEIDESRRLLDKVLARAPEEVSVLVQRGELELAASGPGGAAPWLRKAVALAPYDREAVYNLVQCLNQLGQKDQAVAWQKRLKQIEADLKRLQGLTQQVLRTPHDPNPRCEAGKMFLGIGNDKEGLRWLASALKEDPRHEPTHQALAAYYRRLGRPDLAAEHELAGGTP